MSNDVYKRKGYKDRDDYLNSLAREYGVSQMEVWCIADMLGPNEDFDGLLSALEEL